MARKLAEVPGDVPQIDVTPLLLKECGIRNGKRLYAYKRINITGEELLNIADAQTGVEEGLKIKRTISVSNAGPSDIFVDLTPRKSKDWIDIEDIDSIKDGQIRIDQRKEKNNFSITGNGVSQTYGCQIIYEARYSRNTDPNENIHEFEVLLDRTS